MSMKPCTNPQICGVQNHREGTACYASSGGTSAQSGISQGFGAVSKGASASQKHLPEGFSAESVVQLDSGSVTIGRFGDSGQVAVFQAKGNDNPYATICVGQLGDLSDHDEDETGYPSSTPVVAMGVEVGESSDDFPPRELSMHNGQVIMDNGLWAVPGTPYAGHSTLDQFAATSGAGETGAYNWEASDERAYPEGDMEREWGTKRRFDTAYVMRDFAHTDEGKAYFNSMNLPQLDESKVSKGSPYAEHLDKG